MVSEFFVFFKRCFLVRKRGSKKGNCFVFRGVLCFSCVSYSP